MIILSGVVGRVSEPPFVLRPRPLPPTRLREEARAGQIYRSPLLARKKKKVSKWTVKKAEHSGVELRGKG